MAKQKDSPMELGRRERQIMSFIYARGQATAAEVQDGIDDSPSYSGVRAMLRILEEKGFLEHAEDGPRYVYRPTHSTQEAQRSALSYLVDSFFQGSAGHAIAALLDHERDGLSGEELDRLSRLIEDAKREGR